MSLEALLIRLRALGATLQVSGDKLLVGPHELLTGELRLAIRDHKHELMALRRPYLTDRADLVIPVLAAPQYHWQPLAVTLTELNAPPDVWARYTRTPYPAPKP